MKDELKLLLKNSRAVCVTFKKRDGTTRDMLCTTNPDLVGVTTYSKNSASNEVAQSVWDLEKDAWRSFRWDSVISYKELQNA